MEAILQRARATWSSGRTRDFAVAAVVIVVPGAWAVWLAVRARRSWLARHDLP